MYKKNLFIPFLLLTCSLTTAAEPVDELKAFLDASASLIADFRQTSFDENGNPAVTSLGVFYLQRPGKFRWDYREPFVQQIVADSGKVWFYDQDLEQVTIKKLDRSLGSTPALLLTGEISLEDNFILENQGSDGDLNWIKLLPKDDQSGFKYILIGMGKGRLEGMELNDNFGQLTRIYFSGLKTNVEIDPQIFNFTPPEGADVFEEK
ncbi:MAG: outer membrane lipoprotein chaperone LolA [Gammaproteobacteria bacterium]